MVRFLLDWSTLRPVLCPTCLEVLTDENIVFCHNLAYCPLCSLPRRRRDRVVCLRIFRSALASGHWASFRRLRFFAPERTPRKPLHLVGSTTDDSWLLIKGVDVIPPVIDDNPDFPGPPA